MISFPFFLKLWYAGRGDRSACFIRKCDVTLWEEVCLICLIHSAKQILPGSGMRSWKRVFGPGVRIHHRNDCVLSSGASPSPSPAALIQGGGAVGGRISLTVKPNVFFKGLRNEGRRS